jgi:protein TonB
VPEVRLGPLETGFSRVQDPDKVVTQARPGEGNLPPLYPPGSERRGEQGTVVLRIRVDALGHATQVDVIESSGYPALDAAARARLATWRFRPGQREDGTPAPDVIEIGINFQLH